MADIERGRREYWLTSSKKKSSSSGLLLNIYMCQAPNERVFSTGFSSFHSCTGWMLGAWLCPLRFIFFEALTSRTSGPGAFKKVIQLKKRGNDNPVCETAKETQMYWTVFWTLWKRARVGWYGRMALKHVKYHTWNESPVQIWSMIQGARGWCSGMNQRDGMGKEVGGAFRMGNTCTLMADSSQCMAKTNTIL